MIVVDYSQTAISNLMAEIGGRKDIEVPDGGSGLFMGSSFTQSDDDDLDWLLKP